jgi:predicted dienelactone hydrolase
VTGPARAFAVILLLIACTSWRCDAFAAEWNVGLKRLTLRDPVGGGAMTGFVTYPTTAATTSLTIGRFSVAAAEDAVPARGQFPLLIFSHGAGSLPELYLWLFEGLAARGFVVAGVAHPGDNYNDRSGTFGDAELVERSRHVAALIDGTAGDALLASSIDVSKIGILGHSAGGYTALLAAGGKPDFAQFKDGRCWRNAGPQANPDRPRMTHDPAVLPTADPRIRAAAAMAPAFGCLFDKDSISTIKVPVRFYQADADDILQPGFNATAFAVLFEPPVEVVHVANAGHFVFLNTCPFIMSLIAREICHDPTGTNRDEVHQRLIEDIASFFLAQSRRDASIELVAKQAQSS